MQNSDAAAARERLRPRVLRKHAQYLSDAFDNPAKLAEPARVMLPAGVDTLVGQGLSGALVVPALARELGIDWAMVRKDSDGSHSAYDIEGALGRRWVFVDDLIDSGATRDRVITKISRHAAYYNWHTQFMGSFLYNISPRFLPADHKGSSW